MTLFTPFYNPTIESSYDTSFYDHLLYEINLTIDTQLYVHYRIEKITSIL